MYKKHRIIARTIGVATRYWRAHVFNCDDDVLYIQMSLNDNITMLEMYIRGEMYG